MREAFARGANGANGARDDAARETREAASTRRLKDNARRASRHSNARARALGWFASTAVATRDAR
jgi:hypothetical protein